MNKLSIDDISKKLQERISQDYSGAKEFLITVAKVFCSHQVNPYFGTKELFAHWAYARSLYLLEEKESLVKYGILWDIAVSICNDRFLHADWDWTTETATYGVFLGLCEMFELKDYISDETITFMNYGVGSYLDAAYNLFGTNPKVMDVYNSLLKVLIENDED